MVCVLAYCGLGGYLYVGKPTPWANIDEVLGIANIGDMSMAAIHAFLDLEARGEGEVSPYDEDQLSSYYGDFSTKGKSFRIVEGMDEAFKEYTSFFACWVLLQQNVCVVCIQSTGQHYHC
jgi:hypothetical protein